MKKEDLLKLGIDEETVKKVEDLFAEELKGYIPKSRFDEVNSEKKKLEQDVKDRDAQLEGLKNATGDVEALKQQIEELQKTNAEKDKAHAEEIQNMKMEAAVEKALLEAKAKNVKAVRALLDLTDAELQEDGSIKGLDKQLKALAEAEDSGFLFEPAENKQSAQKGFVPGNSKDGKPGASSDFSTRLAEARKKGDTLEAIKIKREAAAEGVTLL